MRGVKKEIRNKPRILAQVYELIDKVAFTRKNFSVLSLRLYLQFQVSRFRFQDLVMQEFSNLIRYCAERFYHLPMCQQCPMGQCRCAGGADCYNCLRYIHDKTNNVHRYPCEKITYNYVLKHGHRYASEISNAVSLTTPYLNLTLPVSVLSVGCGPSPELYGALDALQNVTVNYWGFDTSNVWQNIQDFNRQNLAHLSGMRQYLPDDFIDFVRRTNSGADILILSYFFSDFIKFHPAECQQFVIDLAQLICEGRFHFVIINDIPLFYNSGTAYYCMELLARQLKDTQQMRFITVRRHFAIPNEFQFPYGKKQDDALRFPIVEQDVRPFSPFGTCGSIQMLIRTVRQNPQHP